MRLIDRLHFLKQNRSIIILFVASTMPASQKVKFFCRIVYTQMEGRCKVAEFGQFCRGEPRNFANWPAEFGKIFRENWASLM